MLVKGILTVKQGAKRVLSVRGTFSGEWGKSVTMKTASLNGLFDTPTDTREAPGESQ